MLCGAKCDLHARLVTVSRYLQRPPACLFVQQQPQRATSRVYSSAARTAAGTHIWWLASSQVPKEQLGAYRSLLTAQERSAVDEAKEPHVAHERLLARALVRWVLSQYLPGTSPQQLQFTRNSNGKPHLVQRLPGTQQELHFNLSHTPDLLGVAVSTVGRVGLDVEVSRRAPSHDPMRLAARRFTQQEVDLLAGTLQGPERGELFMQLWTLKEAFVKALGTGISAGPGLKGFSIGVEPRPPGVGSPGAPGSCGGTDGLGKLLSLTCHYEDPHPYGLLLVRPNLSSQHVAALCLQLCAGSSLPSSLQLQDSSSSSSSSSSSAGCQLPSAASAADAPFEAPGRKSQPWQPLQHCSGATSSAQDNVAADVLRLDASRPHSVRVFQCVPLVGWDAVPPSETRVLGSGARLVDLQPSV